MNTIFAVIQIFDMDTIFAVILCEQLWFLRNSVVHHNVEVNIILVKRKIDGLVEVRRNTGGCNVASWAPPSHWLKCNTDVAIKPSFSTLAAVFRDEIRVRWSMLELGRGVF